MSDKARCTAFRGQDLLAIGTPAEIASSMHRALADGVQEPLLAFDDATGQLVEFDLRGSLEDVLARLDRTENSVTAAPRRRGRPKLGVVAREVTLLPRHWDWLASQPGGASVTLRKLVEQASRTGQPGQQARAARDAAYRFMHALGGDLPGFEEATRALFAGDREALTRELGPWPPDMRRYALRLAFSPRSPAR